MSGPSAAPVVLSVVFSVLAIVAVLLRLYARRCKSLRLQSDDYFIMVGLAFMVGMGVTGIIGSTIGDFGKRQPIGPDGFPITSPKIIAFKQCLWAIEMLSVLALTFTKLSILLFYRRIFSSPSFRIPLWIGVAIVLAWGIAFFFLYLFQCTPVNANWTTYAGTNRHCLPVTLNYANAISTIVTDVMILTMPLPMIWGLQLPTRRKIALSGVFLLGALVCAVSIARLVIFYNTGAIIMKDHDVTFDEAGVFYWTVIEGSLAVVSACLPTLRPIFKGFSPESIIGSIRSRISLQSMGSNKNSNNSNYKKNHAKEGTSNESVVGFGKMSDDAVLENRVVGLQMDHIEAPRDFPKSSIMVHKEFSRHDDRV